MPGLDSTKGRTLLFASVSVIALAVASPELRAADMPPPPVIAKAPAPAPQWEWFVEGAGFWTAGDRAHFTLLPLTSFRPRLGWEGAFGVNYRSGNPWHLSMQFRYGAAKARRQAFAVTGTVPTTFAAIGTATHKEHHWVADFAVGRDIGVGTGQAQAKLGLRIAEIFAQTNGNFAITTLTGYPSASAVQKSKFLGFGPRLSIEGSAPYAGQWSLDYMAGVAVLFGDRKLNVTSAGGPPALLAHSSSSGTTVFNADASIGVSYWFSPNFKFTAGYRADAYWNVLRTYDSGGAVKNGDRIFHGPFVRATARY